MDLYSRTTTSKLAGTNLCTPHSCCTTNWLFDAVSNRHESIDYYKFVSRGMLLVKKLLFGDRFRPMKLFIHSFWNSRTISSREHKLDNGVGNADANGVVLRNLSAGWPNVNSDGENHGNEWLRLNVSNESVTANETVFEILVQRLFDFWVSDMRISRSRFWRRNTVGQIIPKRRQTWHP